VRRERKESTIKYFDGLVMGERKFVSFYVRRMKDNLDDVKRGGSWC
jgi:hypothetical protein